MEKYLEMSGIEKTYHSFGREIRALKGVDFSVNKGSVHGLLGENGAGKSTLMKILAGVEAANNGSIKLSGKMLHMKNAHAASQYGIGMVHQHFSLLDDYTVIQNVVLGMEPVKALGLLDEKKAKQAALDAANLCGFSIPLDKRVSELPMGDKQKVEIMRALYTKAELLIFDEPTSVLVEQEIKGLLDTIRNLKNAGKTIVYISHKVEEVLNITDEVTVLRDGEKVFSGETNTLSADEMVRLMVGTSLAPESKRDRKGFGECVLEVKNLKSGLGDKLFVKDVSLSVKKGEILGIAGISGNGQQELLDALFGLRPAKSGNITFLKNDITDLPPIARRNLGIGYIPEDRVHVGSCAEASVEENLLIDRRHKAPFNRRGWLSNKETEKLGKDLIKRFSIKVADGKDNIGGLSGGHIQRTILARELSCEPKLILAAEVTMGLDVLSTRYIHEELLTLRKEGVAIILVSSNINEILSLSDRVAVMREGEIVADLPNDGSLDSQLIGAHMLGIQNKQKDAVSYGGGV